MPASNAAPDSDSNRTTVSRTHESDPANYTSSHAHSHSNDNRSPPKPPLNDGAIPTGPRPSTPQSTRHYEPRDHAGPPSATSTRERGDSKSHTSRRDTEDNPRHRDQGDSKSHTSRRDTEDNPRHRDQGDSTRMDPPTELPTTRPTRASDDPHASAAKPSTQTLPQERTSSSEDSEYYDLDFPAPEQKQHANPASRSHAGKADYAAAVGGAGRQVGLPREPRPSSNAQEPAPPPPPPPPRNSRSGPEYSRTPSLSSRYLGRFLPTSISTSDPAREEELQRLYAEHQRMQSDLKRAESEIRHLRHANREVDQERARHRENAATLQNELRNVQRELEDYRNLSEIRGKELVGAQVFLTKADLLSASELSQKVNDLNEEGFQAAAWFSESLIHMQRQWKSEADYQSAYQVACKMIGEPAAGVLVGTASEPEPNPILVQLVMQIYFARFCSAKIERWHEGSEEINNFLSGAYGEIRRKEEQAVSGRWRAITHALTRPSSDNWTRDFINNLQQIMAIAGWELSSADKGSAFEQQLKPIFKAILDIRIALGEHFTSADIEVFCPAPGAPFDPQHMEDALDDGRRKKDSGGGSAGVSAGAILGTAGMGLCDVSSRGARSGAGHIVLLPKVILQATLQELLQPASAPGRTNKRKSTVHAG